MKHGLILLVLMLGLASTVSARVLHAKESPPQVLIVGTVSTVNTKLPICGTPGLMQPLVTVNTYRVP